MNRDFRCAPTSIQHPASKSTLGRSAVLKLDISFKTFVYKGDKCQKNDGHRQGHFLPAALFALAGYTSLQFKHPDNIE